MKRALFFLVLIFAVANGTSYGQQKGPKVQRPSPAPPQQSNSPPSPHILVITPAERDRKNPVRFTDVSVEMGKKLFLSQCAMCHGEKADGKGELASQMKINPPDFTKPAVLGARTDGELFAIISHGSGTCPDQAGRLTEMQRWQIVNFLRTVERREPVKATAAEKNQAEHAQLIQH